MSAMLRIEELLLSTGLSQVDVDNLICRFLEEEAFTYVECIKNFGSGSTKTKILKKKIRDA